MSARESIGRRRARSARIGLNLESNSILTPNGALLPPWNGKNVVLDLQSTTITGLHQPRNVQDLNVQKGFEWIRDCFPSYHGVPG